MIPIRNSRRIVVLLVLAILIVATLAITFSIRFGTAVLSARFKPPSQWRVGYHRVDVCLSPSPMMVGWNLNFGPLSVSHLEPWRLSMIGSTNIVAVQDTNFPTQTNAILK